MNEPNLTGTCSDGSTRFRVEPNTFAWALRRVREWKAANGRTELIVSGGILNTYTPEQFWSGFFASGALTAYKGSPPWDSLGIHPYDPYSHDWTCLNNGGGSSCFGNSTSGYQDTVRTRLQTVQSKINSVTGVANNRMFVTEFGFQPQGSVTGPNNAVRNEAEAAEALCNDYNGSTHYPSKWEPWHEFHRLAKGLTARTSDSPDACWL